MVPETSVVLEVMVNCLLQVFFLIAKTLAFPAGLANAVGTPQPCVTPLLVEAHSTSVSQELPSSSRLPWESSIERPT
jgi:hypothetical protein